MKKNIIKKKMGLEFDKRRSASFEIEKKNIKIVNKSKSISARQID